MSQQNSFTPLNIPPALLKNFNPYEVLEPEICHQTKPLIDLGDNHDLFVTNFPVTSSDKGFDGIDLYQNIFVTPQLVKPRQINQTENEINIDFKEFLDKYEFGDKVDLTNRHIEDVKHAETESTEAVCANDSKAILNNVEEDPEDLIEEVLASKALEINTLSDVNKKALSDIKVLTPPKLNKDVSADTPRIVKAATVYTQLEDTVDHLQKITSSLKTLTLKSSIESVTLKQASNPTSNSLNSNVSDTTQLGHDFPIRNKMYTDPVDNAAANPAANSTLSAKDDLQRLNLLKDFLDEVKRTSYNDKPIPNDKIDILKAPVSPRILFNLLPQQVMVKTKRFDREKPKDDCNKKDGPVLEEKTMVLSRLLMQLELRKQALDEESNLKRRLILGARTVKTPVGDFPAMSSTVVLTDDCNRDRLEAFKVRKLLNDLTLHGSPL